MICDELMSCNDVTRSLVVYKVVLILSFEQGGLFTNIDPSFVLGGLLTLILVLC